MSYVYIASGYETVVYAQRSRGPSQGEVNAPVTPLNTHDKNVLVSGTTLPLHRVAYTMRLFEVTVLETIGFE